MSSGQNYSGHVQGDTSDASNTVKGVKTLDKAGKEESTDDDSPPPYTPPPPPNDEEMFHVSSAKDMASAKDRNTSDESIAEPGGDESGKETEGVESTNEFQPKETAKENVKQAIILQYYESWHLQNDQKNSASMSEDETQQEGKNDVEVATHAVEVPPKGGEEFGKETEEEESTNEFQPKEAAKENIKQIITLQYFESWHLQNDQKKSASMSSDETQQEGKNDVEVATPAVEVPPKGEENTTEGGDDKPIRGGEKTKGSVTTDKTFGNGKLLDLSESLKEMENRFIMF